VGTKKTEEELTKSIFDTYSQLRKESASDRRQVYFPRLLDTIIKWSIDYYYKEKTKEYWLEIRDAVHRIVKADNTRKMPENEYDFFKYLKVSLKNAKLKYIKKYEEDIIHIPEEQRQKLKKIKEVIRMEESELGEKLSDYEKVEITASWFGITGKEARKYLEQIIPLERTGSLTIKTHDDDEKEIDVSDSSEEPSDSLEEVYISNLKSLEDKEKLRQALASVFAGRQEKTRPFFRALFTAQCLEKSDDTDNIAWLNDNFKWIQEYLDNDIIETFKKTKKIPTNKEIYIRFHPTANDPDQSVSPRLKEFRKALKKELEKKN